MEDAKGSSALKEDTNGVEGADTATTMGEGGSSPPPASNLAKDEEQAGGREAQAQAQAQANPVSVEGFKENPEPGEESKQIEEKQESGVEKGTSAAPSPFDSMCPMCREVFSGKRGVGAAAGAAAGRARQQAQLKHLSMWQGEGAARVKQEIVEDDPDEDPDYDPVRHARGLKAEEGGGGDGYFNPEDYLEEDMYYDEEKGEDDDAWEEDELDEVSCCAGNIFNVSFSVHW